MKLIKKILNLALSPLKILPFKKDKIIIQSTNPDNYNNNPKYLFEYLSRNKLNIYWFCQNSEVKKYLTKNNFNYISYNNPLKLIYVSLCAKVILDAGSNHFNFLNLIPKSAKKIHIGHGAANKMVLHKFYKSKSVDFYYKKFDYINFPSRYTIKNVARKQYNLDKQKIIYLGYSKFEELKKPNNKKNNSKKIIFYTPTWRPYSYPLPILNLKNFDLKSFKNFLSKNNIIFVYSKHSINSNADNDKFEDKKNIFFINSKKNVFFDMTKYLKKIDLLLNDCSSTSIETLFLNKPQINIFPDLKRYDLESGFITKYQENLTGPLIKDYNDLKKIILQYLNNPKIYQKRYAKSIAIEKNRYYDLFNNNSNKLSLKFIKSLL